MQTASFDQVSRKRLNKAEEKKQSWASELLIPSTFKVQELKETQMRGCGPQKIMKKCL